MTEKDEIVILRHDVDSPFVYKKSLFKKIINRVYLTNPEIPGKEHLPGYLEALKSVLKIEKEFEAKGTFFFRTVTSPTNDLVDYMTTNGHELAYHADRIETFQEFQDDLNKLQNKIKSPIQGFTKHGFAKVRSGGPWNEKKMVEFAKKANLKYLAQGVDHKDWEKPQIVDGVYLFGHHLTIKDAKIEDMIQYIESNEWPMLLLHPEDLFINGVKEKFLKILKVAKAISVKDALESIP